MELAGQAVAVAEPEPALWTGALAAALLLLAEGVIVTDVFTVDFFGDLHPFARRLEVDAVLIVDDFHFFLQRFSDLWKPPKEKTLWGFHRAIDSFIRSAAIVDKVNKVSDKKYIFDDKNTECS